MNEKREELERLRAAIVSAEKERDAARRQADELEQAWDVSRIEWAASLLRASQNPSKAEFPANVVGEIAAERWRQITEERWTPAHDDQHEDGELALAAACYARASPIGWPWEISWWKPGSSYRRRLIKAAALIVAEIERLDRASPLSDGVGRAPRPLAEPDEVHRRPSNPSPDLP